MSPSTRSSAPTGAEASGSAPEVAPGSGVPRSQAYLCPANGEWQTSIEVRRSEFIALARRVCGTDQARDFIEDVRRRHPQARHHCSAFILHQPGAQPQCRSSDDGEPAGTAGQPMAEVLRGFVPGRASRELGECPGPANSPSETLSVENIAVVVVRYFGGILLGTGGLVRAYQDAVREVLGTIDWVRRRPLPRYRLLLEHADAGRVEAELRRAGVHIIDVSYGAQVDMSVAGETAALVSEVTSGATRAVPDGIVWVEEPW